ncbi:MAG: YbhB/YbcL family Raf kinase inhibitor-like protein [Dehalococcoidia bacterium]
MAFTLSSKSFGNGEAIPAKHTADGENISPALSWSDVPENTSAFALIMDDPDAPAPWEFFTHWVLVNIPPEVRELPEGVPTTETLENGAVQGTTGSGGVGYFGPSPPPGKPHGYRFILYALDAPLASGPGLTKEAAQKAMAGHILGEAQLVGIYKR